jgi:hypothetical protein
MFKYRLLFKNRIAVNKELSLLMVNYMTNGWRPIVIPNEIYEKAKEYYEENQEKLKLRNGVRSLTGFINYCIREYLKDKEII